MEYSNVIWYVFRIHPHQDLKVSIQEFANSTKIEAGIILSCGSLEQYNLYFANKKSGKLRQGHFEIVSLAGTFSDTSAHLHLSVSDHVGSTTGGDLLDQNLIYTTAEIAIAKLVDYKFERHLDQTYGYELNIVEFSKPNLR